MSASCQNWIYQLRLAQNNGDLQQYNSIYTLRNPGGCTLPPDLPTPIQAVTTTTGTGPNQKTSTSVTYTAGEGPVVIIPPAVPDPCPGLIDALQTAIDADDGNGAQNVINAYTTLNNAKCKIPSDMQKKLVYYMPSKSDCDAAVANLQSVANAKGKDSPEAVAAFKSVPLGCMIPMNLMDINLKDPGKGPVVVPQGWPGNDSNCNNHLVIPGVTTTWNQWKVDPLYTFKKEPVICSITAIGGALVAGSIGAVLLPELMPKPWFRFPLIGAGGFLGGVSGIYLYCIVANTMSSIKSEFVNLEQQLDGSFKL